MKESLIAECARHALQFKNGDVSADMLLIVNTPDLKKCIKEGTMAACHGITRGGSWARLTEKGQALVLPYMTLPTEIIFSLSGWGAAVRDPRDLKRFNDLFKYRRPPMRDEYKELHYRFIAPPRAR